MDIITFLKETTGVRVSYEDKWLVWDEGWWVVYQRRCYAKKTQVLCMSENQEEAVRILLEE